MTQTTLEAKARRYEVITNAIKTLKAELEKVRKDLADNSDGYEAKKYGARLVSWTAKKRKVVDWEAIVKDYGVDVDKYTTYRTDYAINVRKA